MGRVTDLPHQTCTRCVQDTTVPGISFDNNGMCSFCQLHDKMEKITQMEMLGEAKLDKIF